MSEVFISLIEKLPVDFLMVLIIGAIIVALIILPRVRRDKQGRLYIYSKGYEENQRKQKKIIEAIGSINTRIQLMDTIKDSLLECQAWSQRIILFSQNFSLGERIAAGSVLEQLSDGWKKLDHCYNGEARAEYEKLCKLQGAVNRNEYFVDTARPICKHVDGKLVHEIGDMRVSHE